MLAADSGLASGEPDSVAAARSATIAEAEEFGDVETVEGLFASYGRPIAESLVEEGYLSTASGPSIDGVVDRSEFVDRPEGGLATIADGTLDGSHVIDVRVRQHADGREIEYHLRPGEGTDYAVVEDGDTSVAVTADGGVTELATACCPDHSGCDSDCGSTRCYNLCGCENGDSIYDTEQKCCYVIENQDGTTSCECQWEHVSDCDCKSGYCTTVS